MKILLLEPFLAGSHRLWANQLQQFSGHALQVLSLPGRHWKWRMHGGAISLAEQAQALDYVPDLLLATDMLDFGTFLALAPKSFATVPRAIYFHENQLTYPWSPQDPDPGAGRDNHYGFVNYTSALAADRVYFNSDYHRQSFLQALPNFLKQFPDHTEQQLIPRLQERTQVLPLGLDLERLHSAQAVKPEGPPILLWNHRWEYDKGPQLFFETLFELERKGIDFRLVVLGPSFRRVPPIFKEAHARLAHKVLHWGYAESEQEYARWLQQAHFLPVTSNQDFFGISVVEALYCGCYPLLPMRLAYPEHVPQSLWGDYFYDSDLQFKQQLEALLVARPIPGIHAELTDFVKRYDWRRLAPLYDEQFNQLVYG